MIGEIESKQNQLISKSNENEEKRLFIEVILSLLTIGVISLDENFNIIFYNQTTNTLFKGTKKLENNWILLNIHRNPSRIDKCECHFASQISIKSQKKKYFLGLIP